jgi:hypothetical protein
MIKPIKPRKAVRSRAPMTLLPFLCAATPAMMNPRQFTMIKAMKKVLIKDSRASIGTSFKISLFIGYLAK